MRAGAVQCGAAPLPLSASLSHRTSAGKSTDEQPVHHGCVTDAPNPVYRERAHLVALLTRLFPATLWTDPGEPEWPIVYVETPAGQLSWHIAQDDMDLFAHVSTLAGDNPWDGHDTEEKYRRLDALCTGPGWTVSKVLYSSTLFPVAGCADNHVPFVYNYNLET